MISYLNHPETEGIKAHTDILLNGEYIGYYIEKDQILTAFMEIYGEINSGEFENTKQLEQTIKQIIE
jgi:hypothetical protein